jgi:hypothetical protein
MIKKITVELENYTVNMPIETSHIKFNNNKIDSLQTYDIAQNYRSLQKSGSVCGPT